MWCGGVPNLFQKFVVTWCAQPLGFFTRLPLWADHDLPSHNHKRAEEPLPVSPFKLSIGDRFPTSRSSEEDPSSCVPGGHARPAFLYSVFLSAVDRLGPWQPQKKSAATGMTHGREDGRPLPSELASCRPSVCSGTAEPPDSFPAIRERRSPSLVMDPDQKRLAALHSFPQLPSLPRHGCRLHQAPI